MKNIAVVNAVGISPYAFETVIGGKSAFAMVMEFLNSLPDLDQIIVFLSEKRPELADLSLREHAYWDVPLLLQELKAVASGYDNLFYVYGDTPLLNSVVTRRMYQNHLKYFAQYTFAEGYPAGYTAEILSSEVLAVLSALAEKHFKGKGVERSSLFHVIQKDINAFDLETEISPQDLRHLRVSLSCDNKRNFTQLKSLLKYDISDEKKMLSALEEHQEILRTFPAYVSIQITDGCAQSCSYCPYPRFGGEILKQRNEMSLDRFRLILERLQEFSQDAVISFSSWGEPALHTKVEDFVQEVLKVPSFKLVIETSGLGWSRERLDRISSFWEAAGNKELFWVVSLDSADPALYRKLRGDGFDESHQFAETLLKMFPDRVYIQAVRTRENEEELEKFYKGWKEKTEHLIIQKYDYFSGYLPQLKVADLSPLKREGCWHLKRDLYILLDGTVPLCREDIRKEHVLGNIFNEELESLWKRGEPFYRKHLEKDYPGICKGCDEYYTYNF